MKSRPAGRTATLMPAPTPARRAEELDTNEALELLGTVQMAGSSSRARRCPRYAR